MTIVAITLSFTLAFCGLARWANTRFRGAARLPMQWWLTGEVTWSAPRPAAVALVPALGIGVLLLMTILALTMAPRPGQEAMVLPSFFAIGLMFLGIQIFHLWMVDRTLRRDRY